MPIAEQERVYEEMWLRAVLQEINSRIIRTGGNVSKSVKETIETCKLMWEDYARHIYTFDDALEIKPHLDEMQRQESRRFFYQRMLRKLEKMASSPYFGRIDFLENGRKDNEKIYIGIASLVDEKGVNMVFDWRAPVSGMFYDYELGLAGYNCGMGRIDGRILLKRQYQIKNGRIRFMFDTDLRIEDEMLQEILGRSADERMKTIVTSIHTQLFGNAALFQKAAAGTNIPSQFKKICTQTFRRLIDNRINYEDLAPLLYLKGILEGFPKMNGIKYLFIDEAQDYTPLQYRLFKHIFPKSSLTILGDLNQSVNPYASVNDIQTIADSLDFPSLISIRLEKSYRSTREINNFAEALLPEKSQPGTDGSIRPGQKPELIKLKNDFLTEGIIEREWDR